MVVYATAIIPLIYKLIESLAGESITAKNAEYADDLLAVGSLTALYIWRNHICEIRPKLGYFFQPDKCWIKLKKENIEKARHIVRSTGVNITRGEDDISEQSSIQINIKMSSSLKKSTHSSLNYDL